MLLYPPSLPCIQYTVSHMLHRRMTEALQAPSLGQHVHGDSPKTYEQLYKLSDNK